MNEFHQIIWDAQLEDDCRRLIRLAIREDLDRGMDWTTLCLVPPEAQGSAAIVAREAGVACGLRVAQLVLDEFDTAAELEATLDDGNLLSPGSVLGVVAGPARDILTSERILLNFIGRLSGISTLAHRYAEAVRGTKARVYDTRKTTPGWRRLEKYAVRCGGGWNHRTGLFDAVLIKDNHLAFAAQAAQTANEGRAAIDLAQPAAAVDSAFDFLADQLGPVAETMLVEIEVDRLDQLENVLRTRGRLPHIVLLDNMPPDVLRRAVALRDELAPRVQLEASGGIHLDTIRAAAETGIDRISVGSITHHAHSLDVGLDWT